MKRARVLGAVTIFTATIVGLAGCDRGSAADPAATTAAAATRSAPSTAKAASDANERLLAAAEPFEALTETAFTAPFRELGRLRAEARAKAQFVDATLAPTAATRLQQLGSEVDAALAAQDRTAVAIGAVESYRVLVSAQDAATARVPVEVSLLDYAGFKYNAILKSDPVKWAAMADDVAYARTTWSAIEGRVTSPGLNGAFVQALNAMAVGIDTRNAAVAEQAAASELALVDLLEEHFSQQAH